MNPLSPLLMALRGHTGLPPAIHEPAPAASAGSGSDKQVAEQQAEQLTAAINHTKDPQLQAVFSSALSALHKYLAQDQKEVHQAMGGKMSPRIMARAAGK